MGAATLWDGRGVSWAGLGGPEEIKYTVSFLAHSQFNRKCPSPALAPGRWPRQSSTVLPQQAEQAPHPSTSATPRLRQLVPSGEVHPWQSRRHTLPPWTDGSDLAPHLAHGDPIPSQRTGARLQLGCATRLRTGGFWSSPCQTPEGSNPAWGSHNSLANPILHESPIKPWKSCLGASFTNLTQFCGSDSGSRGKRQPCSL